ncbi:hypothetical protein MPTK1_5g03660 [Marchantia polymorpha subsp. ruderalis]|uniref:Secreted protein n=2 Tax=Marchantia polymorpha TaxID=3197 RepID=A0AAF6BEL8_MARPO|nr:hypothetical protein MARPO_0133s0023 [Marchantia polymorpha]BBN10452.1 hypothetical protein Mp_5g03660 [Marchantia polymorpha subsp. ruderalis]|eukprot:PTQ29874.1 hypothetical protein MARPO_0133s0023 [Marchantia polymorpha]
MPMFVTFSSSLLLVWKMVLSSPNGMVFMLNAFRQYLQPLWSFMELSASFFSSHVKPLRFHRWLFMKGVKERHLYFHIAYCTLYLYGFYLRSID